MGSSVQVNAFTNLEKKVQKSFNLQQHLSFCHHDEDGV